MMHVPDVQATASWYESIGFVTQRTHTEAGCPIDWASLRYGGTELMLSAGGTHSTASRRDVDLYIHTDCLDEIYKSIASNVTMIEDIHDTEYGMREFIIVDPNGFWITFGQRL